MILPTKLIPQKICQNKMKDKLTYEIECSWQKIHYKNRSKREGSITFEEKI